MLRLTLVAEELFTNAVEHGHGGDADAPVRLALAFEPGRLRLLVEDRAPPFDPIAHARSAPPEHAVALDARRVGGLGLLLVEPPAAAPRSPRAPGRPTAAFQDGPHSTAQDFIAWRRKSLADRPFAP